MKYIYAAFIALLCSVSAFATEASVTFINYNPEQISDVKNTFYSASDSTYYYSEYVSDNNIWHIRNISAPGVDSIVKMTGVKTCERLVEGGGYRFAVTATGWLYRQFLGDTSWIRVSLPTADFQTDNLFYIGTRLYIFPRFGRVWFSDDNGENWIQSVNLGTEDNYYYGMNVNNTLYAVGSTTLWYASDSNENYAYNYPPTGLRAFVDYAVNGNLLYLVGSTNTVYKVNGSVYDSLLTAKGKIYGLTFRDSVNLLLFLDDGVYNYSLDSNRTKLLFAYDKPIALSISNVFKSRVSKSGNTVRFALPPNEIIESRDAGSNWHYVRFDLKNSVVKNLCVDSVEAAATVGRRLLKSNTRCKTWYETVFPQFDGSIRSMNFDREGTLIAAFSENQLAEIKRGSDTATIDLVPENYSLIKSFDIDNYNELYAVTNAGLAKSNSVRSNWSILNPAITSGKAKVINNRFFLINSGKIYRFDYFNNVLDSMVIVENGTQVNINDFIDFSDTEYYCSTNNGVYKYNPSGSIKFSRITNGIIENNILKIIKVYDQTFALGAGSNIYVSDSTHSIFGIYNPASLSSLISGIANDGGKNVYLATEGSGVWICNKNDAASISGDYYWKYADGCLEHSRQTDGCRLLKAAADGGKVIVAGLTSGSGFYAEYDVFTGRMKNGFSLDMYNLFRNDSLKADFSAGISLDEDYLAVGFLNKRIQPQYDSVSIIGIANDSLVKHINYGFTASNIFDSCTSRVLMVKRNSNDLFEASEYAVHDSLGTAIMQSELNRYNIISGSFISKFKASDDSNAVVTALNSLRNENRIAVSLKHSGDGSCSVNILNIDSNTKYEAMRFKDNGKILKVLSTIGDSRLIAVTPNKIAEYNVAADTTISKSGLKIYDAVFSGDSVSLIVCNSQTDSKGNVSSYLSYFDLGTMELLESRQIANSAVGTMAIDGKTDKILVYGDDGILRAYPDSRPADTLIADFTLSKYVVEIGNVIAFNDASTGKPQTYKWDFGDGNVSTEANPTHYYTDPGTYSVALEVTKNTMVSTKVRTAVVKVLSGLTIDFAADKTNGFKPMTVKFTEAETSPVQTRIWKFGDGSTSSEANPTHVYETAGKFTVGLYISNGVSSDSLIKSEYINVDTVPNKFIVDFSADVTAGSLPLSVKFTAATKPSATFWTWNFGDGSTSIEENPTHTYTDYGNYNVTLTAGKEYKSAKTTKERYIRISRGALEPLVVIDEIENKTLYSDREGLSSASSTGDFAGYCIKADSSGSSWGELAVYNTGTQEMDYYNLAGSGSNPTPRFISSAANNVFTIITASQIKDYNNLKVMKYNSFGENTMNFTARKNVNVIPMASISDGNNIIVASIGNDTSLMVSAFTTNTEYIFDKEYGSWNFSKPMMQICSNWNNYVLCFKESDTSKVKILDIAHDGSQMSLRELFNDPYYHVSDIYSDNDLSIVVCGNYRYSEDLEPVYSFVAKFDQNLNQIFFTKIENSHSDLKSITETLTPKKEKRFIAAGSINGQAGFLSFDINGNLIDKWKLANRTGIINDVEMMADGKMVLTGTVYNLANRKDFYSLVLSASNYYSTVCEGGCIKSDELAVYPNPTNGLININLDNAYNLLKLTDASGKTVYLETGNGISSRMYDFTSLAAGNYFLTISDGKITKTGRIVIVK